MVGRRVCLPAVVVVVGVRDCVRRWWWRRRQRYQRLLTQLGHHQRPGPEAPIRRHAEAHSHRLRMLPKRRPGDAGGWWRWWWRGRRRRRPRVGRQPALRRRFWLHLHVRGGGLRWWPEVVDHLGVVAMFWFCLIFWGSIFNAILISLSFSEISSYLTYVGYIAGLILGLFAKSKKWNWLR